jgi:hypothetical protein
MKWLLAIAILIAVPARAADVDDARKLFMAGRQAFEDGRLDVAADSFEMAYRLSPHAGLLWNLGQTYQRQFVVDQDPQKLKRAVDNYRRYLVEAPNGANRDEATRLLTELVPILLKLAPDAGKAPMPPPPPPSKTEVMVVTEAPHASVVLDGAKAVPAPLMAEVKAGEHHAEVSAPGFRAAQLTLTAVEGRLVVSEARLDAEPARLALAGAGGEVRVDGKTIGALPLEAELPAGKHTLLVTARGREYFQKELTLERGGTLKLAPSLPRTSQRKAAWWLLGVTVAGALTTIAAGAVWAQAESAASSLYDQQQKGQITNPQLADYDADRSRRDAWRTGTYVALGLTGVVAAITAALFVLDRPTPRAQ